jgi:hypothetical protein
MSQNEPLPTAERRKSLIASLLQKLNLRFPGLFVLLGLIFFVDLAVPDFIPFVDEIVLAILTTIFGLWQAKRPPEEIKAPPMGYANRPVPPGKRSDVVDAEVIDVEVIDDRK